MAFIQTLLINMLLKSLSFFLVEPNLDKVAKTQLVIFNRSSFLWCSAQGAPAPFIVWKKNGKAV